MQAQISIVHAWLGVVALACVLSMLIGRRFGNWARLVEIYPAIPRQRDRRGGGGGGGGRVRVGMMVFGRGRIRNSTWLEIDDGHLHVSAVKPIHVFRAPFSVPLEEITASPDVWMGGLLPFPVVRLTLARMPGLRIMVPQPLVERLAAMSEGRLRITASGYRTTESEVDHAT